MVFRYFCCCFDLRVGAIAFGWIGSILTFTILLGSFIAFGYRNEISFGTGASPGLVCVISIIAIFCFFVKLMTYILLLNAAIKKQYLDLLPWLIIDMIGIGITASIGIVITIISSERIGICVLLILLIVGIIIGTCIYLWLCVYSLYSHNKDPYGIQKNGLQRIYTTNTDIERLVV